MYRFDTFKCRACGYQVKLEDGTPAPDQTLGDLNTDFADYEVFLCSNCHELITVNDFNPEFKGDCPICSYKLHKIPKEEYNNVICPKCGKEILQDLVEEKE